VFSMTMPWRRWSSMLLPVAQRLKPSAQCKASWFSSKWLAETMMSWQSKRRRPQSLL